MKKNFKNSPRTAEQEINLIKSGNIETLRKAIKFYALTPKAQCLLLEEGNEKIIELYLQIRRPGPQLVGKVLKERSDDKNLVKKVCIGCNLSEANEAEFVRIFKDDMPTLEEYLRECPEGPTFLDTTMEVAEELGIADLLTELEGKFAVNQTVNSTSTFADLLVG